MELRENTFVHSLFFLECDTFNWMATVFRHGNEPWEAEYRFRYFADDKVQDSEDTKSFYNLTSRPEADSDKALASVTKALRHIGGIMSDDLEVPFEELTVEGGQDKLLEVLKAQPWANIREVSAEEAKAMGLVKERE